MARPWSLPTPNQGPPWVTDRIWQWWWCATSKSCHKATVVSILVSWIACSGWSQLSFCEYTQATLERSPGRGTNLPAMWVSCIGRGTFDPSHTFRWLGTPADTWLQPHERPRATSKYQTHRDNYGYFKQTKFRSDLEPWEITNTDTTATPRFSIEGMEAIREVKLLTQSHSHSLCGGARMSQRILFLASQNTAPEVGFRIQKLISRLIYLLWGCDNMASFGVHSLPLMNLSSSESINYLVMAEAIQYIKSSSRL